MRSGDAFFHDLTRAGFTLDCDPIPDGKFHRVHITGDKPRSKNGWYVLYDSPFAGAFGNWKSGEKYTWKPDTGPGIFNREVWRQQKAEREKQQAEARQSCREKALKIWTEAKAASDNHPYLARKGVKAHGLKVSTDGRLIIPLTDGITTHGLQFISPEGDKRFLTDTAKSGNYYAIGTPNGIIFICEGYATGASIHEATGHAVAVAFDAGNLISVAEKLSSKYPGIKLIVCADNDQWTQGPIKNPGLTKAREAAQAVNGLLAVPSFKDLSDKPTDFNDLHRLEGLEEVRKQIEAAVPVIEIRREPEEWPEPSPLPNGLPPVKQLDPEMIPLPLRGLLMDISDRMQIPPDFSTAAVVVALGSIIGRGCGIYPKRQDDWLVVPNLWGAVVGRPSLMKTPAVSEAQRHLVRLETEAREEYEAAAQSFEIDKEVMKAKKSAIGDELKKAVKKDIAGDIDKAREKLATLQTNEPARRRYQTQDGTTEKIGELLNENPRGLLVNRDELIGWFRSLDREGREGDRAFYLEAWNGDKGFTYDRIGRGTLDIPALCVSIFGAITPGPLSNYVYQANRGGNGDDGLLQRFQVFVWPDAPAEWKNVDRFPDTKEKNRAWELFKALSNEIPGAVREEGADIPALRFSPEGQEIFDTWRHDLETRLRGDHGLPPALESHLTKYRSLMPSLALIFHLVDVADGKTMGPVSEQAALMAAAWCDYLESHAGRIYGGATTPGIDAAREIVKHIRRGDIQDGVTFREIYRKQWARLAAKEEVKAGMEVLQEYDWLAIEMKATGGRSSETIRLNPRLKF